MSSPTVPAPAAAAISPSPTFPELYERHLVGPLFRPWAELLLARVPLHPGARVLDVACGTGIVARLARRRTGGSGRVVGVDRSEAMLDVARAIDPSIDWRAGDATAPSIAPDETFDVAFCHQGLQFFGDRAGALRAVRRVLVPGGRFGVGVWRAIEENGLFAELNRVAERHVGPVADLRHAFGDAEALAALLEGAGFADVRVEAVSIETRFTDGAASLARLNAAAIVGMSEVGKGMPDAEREALVDAVAAESRAEVRRYERDGAIVFPTSANLATATA